MEKLPHIAIEYRDDISSSYAEYFRDEIDEENLDLKVRATPNVPYAAFEWVIPTAVVIYITKAYFDTFLKEMAKDHYALVKKGTSYLANKLKKDIKLSIIASGKHKIQKEQIFSLSISIRYIHDQNGQSFKFLFRETASAEQITEASGYFLDLIKEYSENGKESVLGEKIYEIERPSVPVLVCYNEITKEARILQPNEPLKLEDISHT